MDRKTFLKLTGMGAAALATLPLTSVAARRHRVPRPRPISVRPLPGVAYTPSDLKFCRLARFATGAEALRHLRHRNKPMLLAGG